MQQVNFDRINTLDYRSNEAYKSLRTNILFCGNFVKTICLTSCLPNEGKSNISFRLATAFAESGKKIIFVDADLRKSIIIGRYKLDREVIGLAHYLSGQCNIDDVLYETNVNNLDIIFTGPVPPNPVELLGSTQFQELIIQLRKSYDYVIIDTPPLGSVIDSAVVAEFCDGVIFVIEANTVSCKIALKVKSQLQKGNSRILGAVLNKVDLNGGQYGYYGGKYKKYEKKYYTA